jgi:2-polyprenyl-3-methyl-5-hydroxy-6-metoxy-1,4-benzoquinol methylase
MCQKPDLHTHPVEAQLSRMRSKTERVKSLFEVPNKYLGPRQFDIKLRAEAVQELTDTLAFERVLDIGCGDGSISLPLLPRCDRLTLLDLSTSMLDLARRRLPSERLQDIDLITGDFVDATFAPESFDLIFCIGVLAHVDSPSAVIARVARLAKPGAWIILEFTDSFHFWGVPVVLYQKMLKLLRPEPYNLNRLTRREVLRLCQANGLRISGLYRYGLPPLGSNYFISQNNMYNITRYMFGPPARNRNRWMGNQYIYRLQKS